MILISLSIMSSILGNLRRTVSAGFKEVCQDASIAVVLRVDNRVALPMHEHAPSTLTATTQLSCMRWERASLTV